MVICGQYLSKIDLVTIKTNETMRTFREIAREINRTWKNVSMYAYPYLVAMDAIDSSDKNAMYYMDSAETIVLYFLSNAGTWRGKDAKRIKAELKDMIK